VALDSTTSLWLNFGVDAAAWQRLRPGTYRVEAVLEIDSKPIATTNIRPSG
jgi:hypothetical protein